ncbi:Ras- protein Rab-28 [Phlyctochytrium planicorne]|nr:Ras- protein Rab-28 [Phlyctochytrium planicorne]
MTPNYLHEANAILLIYDITHIGSFQNLEEWIKLIHKTFLGGIESDMNAKDPRLPFLGLLGNKSDLSHIRVVKPDRHYQLASDFNLVGFFVSARTGDNLSSAIYQIAAELLGVSSKRIMSQEMMVQRGEIEGAGAGEEALYSFPGTNSDNSEPGTGVSSSLTSKILQELQASQRRKQQTDDNDVCYASESGGLKGKVRVTKDGRHSFLDEDERKISPTVSKLVEKEGTRAWSAESDKERGRTREPRPSPTRHTISSALAAKEAQKKRSTSADAWKHLVTKETKNRTKFYGTEKTLLVLLEEERARFSQLEEEYHKLLAEVHALQTSHLQDLKNLDRRSDADMKSLQKALVLKTEESNQSQKELQQFHGRYAKESAGWIAANERLEANVKQLEKMLKEVEKRSDNQERIIHDISKSKKEISEVASVKEAEGRKLFLLVKEKEAEWAKEKEMRMKLEVQALQLDHFVAQRDEEIKSLRNSLQKKAYENDELQRTRSQLQDARQDLDDMTKRERMYLEEIEQLNLKERKLFSELDDLTNSQKRALDEIERLSMRESSLIKELEQTKVADSKLQQEITEVRNKLKEEEDEVALLAKQARLQQIENSKMAQDLFEARAEVHEKRLALDQKEAEIRSLKETEIVIRRERDEARVEIATRQAELSDLQKQVQDIGRRLEHEVQSKFDIKHQNKEKLIVVAEKISDLQESLSDTQLQISELKQREDGLKANLRQKDDTIASLQKQLNEQQQSLNEAQSHLAKESYLNESLKSKKKEELLALQEKFSSAKAAMEQEAQSLRNQLNQKNLQATASVDETSRLKIEVSELTADRFRLEARLTELTALESSHSRQISNLQQQLRQRDQELSLLSIKHQTLLEQLKRIDDEILSLKTTSQVLKDTDGSRFQNNINDLSRRVKAQLSGLLDTPGGTTSGTSNSTTGFSFFNSAVPPTSSRSPLKSSSTTKTDEALHRDSKVRQNQPLPTESLGRRGERDRPQPSGIQDEASTRDSVLKNIPDNSEYQLYSSGRNGPIPEERSRFAATYENKHIAGLDDFTSSSSWDIDLAASYSKNRNESRPFAEKYKA